MLGLCWGYVGAMLDHFGSKFEDLGPTWPLEGATWPLEGALGTNSLPQDAFQGGEYERQPLGALDL